MILHSLRILKELEKAQYLPPEELKSIQSRKLQAIIRHAYEHVHYYRDRFDRAGIKPQAIKNADDLVKVPTTTKEDLQKLSPQDILTRGMNPKDCVVKHTSGSTGKPLKLFFSAGERDFQSLLNLRIFLSAGFKLTDKTVYLINPNRFPYKKYWFQYLNILGRFYLSVFDPPETHWQVLKNIRPDIIYGYPSNLTILALFLKERGVCELNPKAVFSSAEALERGPKKVIASALKTDVYDILGLVETGDIAWECPAHEGYHMNSDAVIMEFLDEHGSPVAPGQPGRLVCTSLYGYTMPLIRYEVGDICVPTDRKCSCGRTLPLIESIQGRANDFIVLPGGQIIASCFLVIIMQEFHDVAQYRIIQENTEGLVLQLVKGEGFNNRTPVQITERIKQITKNALDVKVEILEKLPRDESGKIRTVVSKIIPGFQG